jgi:hypothetical protein
MNPEAAAFLSSELQAKRQTLSFLWYTRRFTLYADRTLCRYDGEQLCHSAAITSTTSVAKVGDAEFTVTFLQPDLRYHIRAASSAERDSWVRALADAIANRLDISHTDRYLGRRVCAPDAVCDATVKQLTSDQDVLAPMQQLTISQAVLPIQLVCAAVRNHAQRSRLLPPRLPPYMQLEFLPLQLQRFLRGCVLAAAHSLVTPPASVFHLVHARTKSRWIDRIFVCVMSGFVARAEVRRQGARCACRAAPPHLFFLSDRMVWSHWSSLFTDAFCRRISGYIGQLCCGFGRAAECRSSSCSRLACAQAAAQARIAGSKGGKVYGVHNAAEIGDVAAVQGYLIADASCVNQPDGGYFGYDWTPTTPACIAIFAMLISCVRLVSPPYTAPLLMVTLKWSSCCCRVTPPLTREPESIAPTTALLMKEHC